MHACIKQFFHRLVCKQGLLDMVIWSVCATVADIRNFPWGKRAERTSNSSIEKRFQNYQVVNHENKDKASPGHKHKTQLIEVSKQDSSL